MKIAQMKQNSQPTEPNNQHQIAANKTTTNQQSPAATQKKREIQEGTKGVNCQ
jgi:hypothetical protein